MIKKKKYIQPQSQLFALCAECENAIVSKVEGLGNGGDGTGGDMNAKQNNWFDWDDDSSPDE